MTRKADASATEFEFNFIARPHQEVARDAILAARAAGSPTFCVPYGYNEGKPVDSADCDALVSDLLAAYQQALTFKDLPNK